MNRVLIFFVVFLTFSFTTKEEKHWRDKSENADYVHRAIKQITDVMVHDIYSPPVAGRTYAYISIAGYEATVPANPSYKSLSGQLHGLKPMPKPAKEYSPALAAVQAILTVGKSMVVSEKKVEAFYAGIMKEFKE